ncbi:porin family protein [Thaumasiovibrio subtropicus]|uniref:porin family protein n=1 Tax=Thaumasiovibrio subtropicus TaxID=1891207 RepID=UPI000B34B0D0|nr:porin family protein [Thaumasiovibrio subtropicus]
MKLNLLIMPTLLGALSFNALASIGVEDFSIFKHRVGLGYSITEVDSGDYGSGLKLEYGYDFNQYVGLFISAEMNEDADVNESLDKATNIKVGTDIGYTFEWDKFSLKPYGTVGFYSYDESTKSCDNCFDTTYDDDGVYFGVGVRFHYDRFYVDLKRDHFSTDYEDANQMSATFGYRF